ncbi:MAG: hypothetical protein ACK5TW_00040, partial [Cyanobacteriota bacterium]
MASTAVAFAVLLLLAFLLSAFSTMILFFVETPDWSSSLVRPNKFEEIVVGTACAVVNSWIFTTVVVLVLALVSGCGCKFHPLTFSKLNGGRVESTLTTIASFLLALIFSW